MLIVLQTTAGPATTRGAMSARAPMAERALTIFAVVWNECGLQESVWPEVDERNETIPLRSELIYILHFEFDLHSDTREHRECG